MNVERQEDALANVLRQETVQTAESYRAATEEARVADKERVLAVQKRTVLVETLRRSMQKREGGDSKPLLVSERRIHLICEGSSKEIDAEIANIRRELKNLEQAGKLSTRVRDLLVELNGSFTRYTQDMRLLERIEKTIESTDRDSLRENDPVQSALQKADPEGINDSNHTVIVDLAAKLRERIVQCAEQLIRQLETIQDIIHSVSEMEETLRSYFFTCLMFLPSSVRESVVVRHRTMMRRVSIEKRCTHYKALIAELIKRYPGVGDHLHRAARSLAYNAMKEGDYQQAKTDLLTAMYFTRENEDTLRLLIKILLKLGESELAFTAQKTVLQLCPNDVKLRKDIAAEWVKRAQYERAIQEYEEILASQPEDESCRRELGRLLFEIRNHQRVPLVLKEYLEKHPTDSECLLWMGCSLVLLERWDDAVPYLRRRIANDPHCWKATLFLAMAYRKLKFFNEALDLIEPFRVHEKYSAQASMIAGDILQERGEYAAAEQVYQQAKMIRGTSVTLARALGLSQLLQGKSDRAVESLHESIRLDAHASDSYLDLARVFRRQRKYAESESILARILSQRPDSPEARQELAVVYTELGQWDKAAAVLQTLVPEPKRMM